MTKHITGLHLVVSKKMNNKIKKIDIRKVIKRQKKNEDQGKVKLELKVASSIWMKIVH